MAKGWIKAGGNYNYMDKSTGIMKSGWLKDGDSWYYLKLVSGAMACSEKLKIGSKTYRFNKRHLYKSVKKLIN